MNALDNQGAERTVLGCALLNSDCLYHILSFLRAQDFALSSHRLIYHVIAHLADAGKPVDDMTVADALIARGQLETVGGVGYIAALSDSITSELARITHAEHYVRLVLDLSRRRQVAAAAEALTSATRDPAVTTEECLQQIQESLLQIEAVCGKTHARHGKEFMPEVLRDLEKQASNKGLGGMPTGIPSLDQMTGGIRPGELWTIGALPGKGKTALGLQITLANGRAGTPTYIFSLEMQDLEIGKRFLAAKSSLPAIQLRDAQTIRPDRWRDLVAAAVEIAEWPIWVDARSSLTIQNLLSSSRLHIRRHGVKLIVVDYLRLVDAPGREMRDQVSYVANALRQLAKNERIGVVLLSQLRRPAGGLNAKPSIIELKESGDIEAHSHVVLLPHLPVGDNGNLVPEEEVLIIGKNRNGSIGSLPILFDEKRLQFLERTTEPG